MKEGKCNVCPEGNCGHMGFLADQKIPKTPSRYFMTTADHSPFCEYHVDVSMRLNLGFSHERGDMKVQLHGTKSTTTWITLNEERMEFYPGVTYTFSTGIPNDLGDVHSVQFAWHHLGPLLNPLKWNIFGGRDPYLALDGIDVWQYESAKRTKFCENGIQVHNDK